LGNSDRHHAISPPLEIVPPSEHEHTSPGFSTPGRSFGRYRLLDEIGRGGMAVVSRAVMDGPRGFTRTVVIKRILSELASQPSFVDMLATEARLSALLCHRNIVQVYEFGQIEGEYYVAMEYVDGTDLLDLLRSCATRRQRLPVAAACHIVGEVANALAYAHALKDAQGRPLEIVHRDISPSNIMVSRQGEAKLLDFGIAKAAHHARDEVTVTGVLKGKISYLSPEQAEGLPLDRRSDIFSLGIVFHECLTMRRLFRGQSDLETLRLVREARAVPPSTLAPGIPPELDAIVLKMLARDPNGRFASCDELLAALGPVLHHISADPAALRGFLQVLGPTMRRKVPASIVERAPSLEAARWPTRRIPKRTRRRWALAAGALALVTIALAYFLPGSAPPPLPKPEAKTAAAAHRDAPPAPPAAAVATPAPPERVRLSVTGPRGAELLLDGKLVGTLPVDLSLPSVPGQRRLRVQALGARPWHRLVAADVDVALEVKLDQPARPAVASPARRHAAPSGQPASQTPSLIKDPFAQ
jgi:serine/threonine protein kinase